MATCQSRRSVIHLEQVARRDSEMRHPRKQGRREDASRLGCARYRKRLDDILSITPDEPFIQLIWAISRLAAGEAELAARFISFPPEAVGAGVDSNFFVPPWEAETLVNELLAIPKADLRVARRIWNCRAFGAIGAPINALKKLENAQSGRALERISIFHELPRIAHRQFPWQRGYFNKIHLYRWHFLFGGFECRSHFSGKFGLTPQELCMVGFGLYAHFQNHPVFTGPFELDEIGLTAAMGERAIELLSVPHAGARRRALEIRNRSQPVAYQRSVLRETPLLTFRAGVRCPLVDLLFSRVTDGIYYDLVGGPPEIRNEIGRRFELYVLALLAASLPALAIRGSSTHKVRNRKYDAPDGLILRNGEVAAVLECKAKKMTFDACFSETSLEAAEVGYNELTKGVVQIWRFYSYVRRGFVRCEQIAPDSLGVVITLDSWLTASSDFKQQVLARARARCRENDPDITEDDMKPVAFCPIEEVEMTTRASNEDDFISAIQLAAEDAYSGWALSSLHRDFGTAIERSYPFEDRLGEVLPWWDRIDEVRAQRQLLAGNNAPQP